MDAPKRILVVDDEPNVRLVFRTALESTGFLVTEAADGDAALVQLGKIPIDLILLDLKMPVMNGMETLERLRTAGDETPVVVVTAHGSVPDAVAAMKLGAVDFLPKPVSPVTLRAVVASVCGAELTAPRPQRPLRRQRPLSCLKRTSDERERRWNVTSTTMRNSFCESPTRSNLARRKSAGYGKLSSPASFIPKASRSVPWEICCDEGIGRGRLVVRASRLEWLLPERVIIVSDLEFTGAENVESASWMLMSPPSQRLRTTCLVAVLTLSRRFALALVTLTIGLVLFALFFGLVASCDQL